MNRPTLGLQSRR